MEKAQISATGRPKHKNPSEGPTEGQHSYPCAPFLRTVVLRQKQRVIIRTELWHKKKWFLNNLHKHIPNQFRLEWMEISKVNGEKINMQLQRSWTDEPKKRYLEHSENLIQRKYRDLTPQKVKKFEALGYLLRKYHCYLLKTFGFF